MIQSILKCNRSNKRKKSNQIVDIPLERAAIINRYE